MRDKIIAVDFDGTLIEEGKWPGIGATNEAVLNYCKTEQAKGARIILWTNRVDEPLQTAIKWCEEHGLHLDAINDNLPESVEFFGTNTRKIYADEFIDDRMAKGFKLPYISEVDQLIAATATRLLKICTDDYASRIWRTIETDVVADVLECTADEDSFTDGDVALAIGRAICERLGLEN